VPNTPTENKEIKHALSQIERELAGIERVARDADHEVSRATQSYDILVTGGAGYLGCVLVPFLLSAGHKVTVLDNFSLLQTGLLACCSNPRFSVIRGDSREKSTLEKAIAAADVIIPLAALVGAPMCDADPTATVTTNLEAIKLLLSLRSNEQRVIYPCTNSGYGIGENNMVCTEETPLRPISLYGRTKTEAEAAVLASQASVTLRLATVFGVSPRMRLDLLVNDFVHRAVTDRCVVIFEGHFKRNYIHIRDVARAFLHVLDNFESMTGNAYNVGLSTANLSKLELCRKIQEHIPSFVFLEAPVGEDPDKRDYIVSNEKIEKTGYSPSHSLDYGIQELSKAYRMIRGRSYANA
jgi:nucleoside-diphosphate-sugar epimerase